MTIEQRPGPPPTLLIVDDDDASREGLARMLADAGYRVLTADSFHRGVDVLKAKSPDLLILDVRLGDFNGMQLIVTAPHPIPAIVVTGFTDKVVERDARELGAEYLVKPITRDLLLSMIERQLPSPDAGRERRWMRKHLSRALPTQVNERPGQLLDVSYGGARLEIDAVDDLPPNLAVALPGSQRFIHLEVVWSVRHDEGGWQCGAAVAEANDLATQEWRELVDSV